MTQQVSLVDLELTGVDARAAVIHFALAGEWDETGAEASRTALEHILCPTLNQGVGRGTYVPVITTNYPGEILLFWGTLNDDDKTPSLSTLERHAQKFESLFKDTAMQDELEAALPGILSELLATRRHNAELIAEQMRFINGQVGERDGSGGHVHDSEETDSVAW